MPARTLDTPIGKLGLVGSDAGLSRVRFHARPTKSVKSCAVLDDTVAQLAAYFSGDLIEFDLPRDLEGTDFQRQCWLALASKHITDLQNSPGRLVQSLERASAQMFERVPAAQRVDYYVKGPVVGLVLDAHIRKATNGRKSMDDVIRLEYARWSGKRGFTAEDFARTASDAAGIDLEPLLHTLVATTDEVDYSEMLDWFGLRFAPNDSWTLQVRPDATSDQRAHLAALLAPSRVP